MGIKKRNAQSSPQAPWAPLQWLTRPRSILLPPSNDVAVAAAQTFTSLAGNALATAGLGLVNPILLNGSGSYAIQLNDSTNLPNRVGTLPIPAMIVFTCSQNADLFLARIKGVDHLGRKGVWYERKSSAAIPFLWSTVCYSHIDTIELIESNPNAGADTIQVGYQYTGLGGNTKRIPLSFDIQNANEIMGISWISVGGGTFSASAAGTFIPLNTGAPGAFEGPQTFNIGNGLGRFQIGNATAAPTTPLEYIVVPRGHAFDNK